MDNSSPLTSQSASKENDSIDDASAAAKRAQQKAGGKSEDDFEDSLNVSISEHISEEIESMNNSSAVEDSIERPPLLLNQSLAAKKRQLFDFDDSDRSDTRDGDGIPMFSKFNLEESLSGENIAKHFATDTTEMAALTTSPGSVNEPIASQNISQHTINSDELKIANVNDGAANRVAATAAATTTTTTPIAITSSKPIDEMQKSKDSSNLIELTPQSDSHRSVSDDKTNGKNDVILINDHEISIHSLMELQRQRSRTDIAYNQNTTSDISDLQAEDNAKEQRSIDDISMNESSEKVESPSATGDVELDRSKSVSDKVSDPKSDSQSENNDESTNNDENIKKCQPIDNDDSSLPELLSVIEEVSAADEQSSHHQLIESNSDKKNEMRKIIDDAVFKLPLDKENRPPGDDALSIDSRHFGSSQNSTTTDGTVYTAFGKPSEVPTPIMPTNLGDDFILNLNKIKEIQNSAGKSSAGSYFDSTLISSSRRESLKDFAQSGRESSSITTNSTEYQTFQDEFTRVSITRVHIYGRSIQSIKFSILMQQKSLVFDLN